MKRIMKSLPIVMILMVVMLAGMVSAFGGPPTIGTCTLNSASASNATVSASTNSVGCVLANVSSANVTWGGVTTPIATATTNIACTNTDISGSNETAVTVSCDFHAAGDSAKTWYFAGNNGSTSVESTHYSIATEGSSGDQDDVDAGNPGGTTTTIFSNGNMKVILPLVLLVIAGLLLTLLIWQKKK